MCRFVVLQARNVFLAKLEQDFVADLRTRLFRQMSEAPWSELALISHGEVQHALSRNLDRASFAVGALLRSASAGVLLVFQLGLAVWLSPFITLLVCVTGGAVLAALTPLRRRASKLGRQMTQEDYQLFSTASGFLGGLKSAKAHGLEAAYLDNFSDAARSFSGQVVAVQRDNSLASLLLQSAMALLGMGAVVLGYHWLSADPATLVVLLLLLARLTGPLQILQGSLMALRHGNAAYQSALSKLDGLSKAPVFEITPILEPPAFSFRNISHQFDLDAAPIFSGFNCDIPAGAVTAFAGPSGTGKSTLCDLVAGLLTPSAGEVLLSGKPFDAPARAGLQRSMAYVGQTPMPAQMSLRDSLSWGNGTLEDEEIWQALAQVEAERIVRDAPKGLDTVLRLDGSHFSGGERQRFALARALLRHPKLFVLDEASNALDLASEASVLGNLFAARNGATVILVSHRPETVALADHVVHLQDPK